jgi:hypothetical protein
MIKGAKQSWKHEEIQRIQKFKHVVQNNKYDNNA